MIVHALKINKKQTRFLRRACALLKPRQEIVSLYLNCFNILDFIFLLKLIRFPKEIKYHGKERTCHHSKKINTAIKAAVDRYFHEMQNDPTYNIRKNYACDPEYNIHESFSTSSPKIISVFFHQNHFPLFYYRLGL